MPETSQRPLAGVGVEHIGDSNVSVPELPAGGVNAVDRADLAAEFLAQSVQRFIAFDAVLPQPGDQAVEHFLATIMAVTDTALGLGKRLDHKGARCSCVIAAE
jgi:hypothetical protein